MYLLAIIKQGGQFGIHTFAKGIHYSETQPWQSTIELEYNSAKISNDFTSDAKQMVCEEKYFNRADAIIQDTFKGRKRISSLLGLDCEFLPSQRVFI
jgi:hypothetical protein